MKKETFVCDIDQCGCEDVKRYEVPVMFDHDQEDGRSKTLPYFEMKKLDLCLAHFSGMCDKKRSIYAYGAMGYNKYYLN